MNNVVIASFEEGKKTTITASKYQYDHGQILLFVGLDLPATYEVDFSNFASGGDSMTMLGDDEGVDIPDELLATGRDIYAFVYLHEGEDDGETVYVTRIPVIKRPQKTDYTPSQQQQSAIEQAIAALNSIDAGDIPYDPEETYVSGRVGKALQDITGRVAAIEDAEGLHKYGVSGIGQSASALTRLWDAVGMTAQVGTDGDNSSVINNFDDVTPFNRRKCVGKWELIDGRAVFRVEAYKGDEDYAEDGTMGDYVAVECPRAYYYLKDGVLGVSAHKWDSDWRPFDIFCHDHNPEDTMEFVYLPAYALALKDGKAVSLPGLPNEQGTYYDLVTRARTYDGDVKSKAMLQPAAVNFYEWALFTVEFATQNCQSIMQGCAGLRQSNDDHVTFVDSTHALTNNYYASRVVGEYVAIIATNIDVNSASYKPTHKITAILRCDENGNESSSGTHQLLTLEDLGAGYYTYDTTTEYRLASRPYYTGSCNGVSTPSGSPVSNSDSYHPMQYRWRENVFSNQYKTLMDLFAQRVGTGDSDYYLKWFYILDPTTYTPSGSSKPDATDLATFHELGVQTAHANYASGWIKSKKYDPEFPDIWIPYETTGASASTYFCDYASLVNSFVVRACRVGGYWASGSYAGFSSLSAANAPSYGTASYGGDLCFAQ